MQGLSEKLDKATAGYSAAFSAVTERIGNIEIGLSEVKAEVVKQMSLYSGALVVLEARVQKLENDNDGVLPN